MPQWKHVLVQGASRGLGLALCKQLLESGSSVVATCRQPEHSLALQTLRSKYPGLQTLALDLNEERSVAEAAETTRLRMPRLDMLINCSGLLHAADLQPEKKLGHVSLDSLHRVFAVNAFGPLLMARFFGQALCHGDRAVFANVSARVGSIGDNRLGGWYAYRGSKAAQNMFTKTMAIELGRASAKLCVVALHPGTVNTDLSRPFQRNVPAKQLVSPEHSASKLLATIDGLRPADSGGFFAYDGSPIPW